ncbi:MAG: hypothetical protein ACM3YM_02915 [Sphingomonadales bacterium]
MNRLSPLIVRRVGPLAAPLALPPAPGAMDFSDSDLENLKMFAVAWLGGLVFFGTYLF